MCCQRCRAAGRPDAGRNPIPDPTLSLSLSLSPRLTTASAALHVSLSLSPSLTTASAVSCLSAQVRAAVGPDVEVILDGGVRRGLDIVKGLARGAEYPRGGAITLDEQSLHTASTPI